jgi:hypothetical protein
MPDVAEDQLERLRRVLAEEKSIPTVAAAVLSAFFDELAGMEEFGDAADQLRKLVLDTGVFAEPAVRAALFPDAP